MSLVHASIVPHHPAMLGSSTTDQTRNSLQSAVREIEGELYVMQPETLFVILPTLASTDAFYVHMAQQFEVHATTSESETISKMFAADMELISKLRSGIDGYDSDYTELEIHALDQSVLEPSASAAILALTQHLPNIRLVPITLAPTSLQRQMQFGQFLHSVAVQTNKRIACIIPAHLSSNSDPAVAGYHPDGATFDTFVQNFVTTGKLSELATITDSVIENAQAHDVRSLAVLAGMLAAIEYKATIVKYERVEGTGMLVAQFTVI